MKVIKETVCTQCGKKQVTDARDLLKSDLFWRVCEFCHRYGLKIVIRRKATFREYMEALYNTLGFRVYVTEAFIKDLLKDKPSL
jgi:hypothetical protein